MCGIAGYINFEKSNPSSKDILKKMTDVIEHRGPDGEGFYTKDNVGLGHRRLSIIDLCTGDQPMFNDDKSVALVFNGEIYNYIELREELVTLGHKFKTTSDTEVIIRSYEQWGVDCQNKLNGCWDFALWDDKEQQLLLSRDRIGEKPLHYSVYNNSLIFGSEIKSLFAYGVPDEKDLSLTELYLYLKCIPAPYTFFKHIKKLRPGHFLLVKGNDVKEIKYWDLPNIDENNMITDKQKVNENFESLLVDSVKIRMRSDVPYGALLSGGLDSASIVAIMSGVSKHPIETFTIGYEQNDFDEKDLAQDVANMYKTNHHVYNVVPESFEQSLQQVLHHYDEPFGDSSAIPTGIVSKFARQYVKMVLTGDGGDEVLCGYPSFQGIKFSSKYKKYPGFVRSALPKSMKMVSKAARGSMRYKLNRYEKLLRTSNLNFNESMVERLPTNETHTINALFEDRKNQYRIDDYMDDFMSHCTYKNDFYKLMYLSYKLMLPEDMLVKVDRMSLAHSLEARVPFLDHRLVEYMVHVDKDIKMEGYQRKSILRNTFGSRLPASLLTASKKGFRVPLVEWFKNPELSGTLNKLYTQDFGLKKERIKSLIDDNNSGKKDNSNIIWMLIVLQEILEGNKSNFKN